MSDVGESLPFDPGQFELQAADGNYMFIFSCLNSYQNITIYKSQLLIFVHSFLAQWT